MQESSHLLLAVWGRWDAVHYIDIATKGYQGTDMAFFPLYPFLIRVVGAFAGNHLIAGLLISNASFFFGLLYLYKLLEHEYDRTVARRAIFYISIFPSAVFFSAVYTESLFFMLTVASFYYMRAHRWWLAGVIGFFAALTRVEGILARRSVRHRVVRAVPAVASARGYRAAWRQPRSFRLGSPSTWRTVGAARRPALFFARPDSLEPSSRSAVGQRHQRLRTRSRTPAPQIVREQSLEIAFTVLMIARVARRLDEPASLVYRLHGALDSRADVTSSLMSMPRFALVLFPMFAILARWGERPG